jgi:two-component system, LytTR family, sensor kinase
MKKKFFESNKLQIMLHLLAWAILLLLPLYYIKRFQIGKDFIWLYYINIIINGGIFYTNYFFLVPKFFFDDKKYRYYISITVLFFFFYFVSDRANQIVFKYYVPDGRRTEMSPPNPDNSNMPGPEGGRAEMPPPKPDDRNMGGPHGPKGFPMRPPFRQMHLFNYGSTSLFLIFFSLGLRIMERHSHVEKIRKELEREKLNSELALLKNQISPHFFFNTLNNIYSLISINAEDSQKAVLKLSKMMRYLLYDTEQGNTKLSNEIEFITNYIDLMKLRMSDKIRLSVIFPGDYEDVNIPPLLFIPFIENAFKHGISFRENSFIEISMTCSDNNIFFRCANSISAVSTEAVVNQSGIGLGNVSKRLELLFPGKHELKINRTENIFEVLLKILLKQ